MNEDGFRKLYWGFLFIMIDFRINGFDILPDVAGYILFALGISTLISNSIYFNKARTYNIPMMILSIFSIYQKQNQNTGFNVQAIGSLGIFGILIAIASIVLELLTVYYIFQGIKDMADQHEQIEISSEANKRWDQYLMLEIAAIFIFVLIFIPPIALVYIVGLFIATLFLTAKIMGFMNKCSQAFSGVK